MRSRTLMVAAVLGMLLFPLDGLAAQQGSELQGRVVGRVLDESTGQPLGSAQVFVAGTSLGGLTALDGRYVLRSVPAGTHNLVVQLIGYGSKTVTGVEVVAGRTVTQDVALSSQAIEVEGITVSAAAERGSTTSLMTERKVSAVVSDAIGADQMARSPDGDAASALRRVPGLSVVDGKYAYVRGLGERYSSTTLNGAPLASPVPDKKVIPLDVIPSGLLESIVTAKSYSPDQPGDFAGGLVQLRTRSFPANRILSVGMSGGWSSNATFSEGLGYAGSSPGFLGLGDGTRALPDLIDRNRPLTRSNYSPGEIETIGEALVGDWGPTPRDIPANTSASISFGDDFDISDTQRFGFIAAVNYSSSYGVRNNLVERVFATAGVDDPEVDYTGRMTEHSVGVGGLLNLTYQPRPTDQITLATIYNRLTDDQSRVLQGFNLDSNTDQWNSRVRYLGQTLLNTQLRGDHTLGFLDDAALEWRGAYTRASRYEPDTREVLYRKFDGDFYWDDFIQSGSLFHQDMVDEGFNGAASLRLPFEFRDHPASVSVGAATDRKDRTAYTRRFRFRPNPGGVIDNEVRQLEPNELFVPEHIGPDGFELQEATFRTDNYDASQEIDAAYGMLELEVLDGVRLSGGIRVERTFQEALPRDLFETGLEPPRGAELETTDVLPAANLTLELTPSMNLRGSASRTLARPQLRELAPFSFADYAGGYLVIGNPQLTLTRIQSYDLRWEWFPSARTVVSASAFYKEFDDPIEVTVLPSSELLKTWVNADEADNYGVELEIRSDLGFVSDALSDVDVNTNVTLVESDVTTGNRAKVFLPGLGPTELEVVSTNRALQGQSPYVVNAGLTWAPLGGASASLLFNRFGRRIEAVGGQATSEIFEEARNQLDAVVELPVAGGWKAKLSANRLLGNEVEFTQGGGVLRSYDLGRSVSVSLSWGSGR